MLRPIPSDRSGLVALDSGYRLNARSPLHVPYP